MRLECKPLEPPLLLATDIDGTLVDNAYRHTAAARDLLETLQDAGVVVALVTSKTLEEALIYARRLGLRGDCPGYIIIAEEGGLVYSSSERLLPERLVVLARPLRRDEIMSLAPEWCRGRVRTLDLLAPEEVSKLTMLPLGEADAARLRRYVPAVHGPRDCLEAMRAEAARRGYYARLGRNFLVVGAGAGKERALRELRRASPVLRDVPILAVGDSEGDRGMLEEADYAILMPGSLRIHRGDYVAAASPAPRGWVEEVARLAAMLGVYRGFYPLRRQA